MLRDDLADISDTLQIPSTVTELENQLQSMKPRFFDTYILPAFMMYFAFKAKSMPKLARRMLFASGIYMTMRNYGQYKTAVAGLIGGQDANSIPA